MDKDFKDIVLYEIRENRKAITEVENKVNGLKVIVGSVGAFFGMVGALATKFIAFFSP